MVKYTAEQLCSLMVNKQNIRNISIIAHVDHGKSTLADCLLASNGLISKKDVGNVRATDTLELEKEKGITIKSTGVTLHYELPEHLPLPVDCKERHFLVNLIDSPGHVDFSGEVTAALRLTDGALVTVDCVEGVRIQTETVLQQAIKERIRPALVLNKLDRCFTELKLEPEEIYQTLVRTIDAVNSIIDIHKDEDLGDCTLSPPKGNVAFCAAKMGWGFNIQQFAKIYSATASMPMEKLLEKLWGDHFYDPKKKCWSQSPISESGEKLERGFCTFVLKPIKKIIDSCMKQDKPEIKKMMKNLNLIKPPDSRKEWNEGEEEVAFDKFFIEEGESNKNDKQEREGKELVRTFLNTWIPASNAVLEIVALKLPSPITSQSYRTSLLYTGPQDDEVAKSIRTCDPNGPLVMFISKMIPDKRGTRFFSFGRVFSGTVKPSQKVTILGPGFEPRNLDESSSKEEVTSREDVHKNIAVQQVVLMMGKKIEPVSEVSCGNTCSLVGIDQYLVKTGTVTDSAIKSRDLFPIQNMKYSVSPVVKVAVETTSASDITKLVEGMKRLSKTDNLVQCTMNADTGEHLIAAVGELHLEICLNDLRKFMSGAPLKVSEPTVSFCETVTVKSVPVIAKSPNNHNRIYCTAEPLSNELTLEIEKDTEFYREDIKIRSKKLTELYGWDATESKKIWCFGPDDKGPNILVDATRGIQYMNEAKDSMVASFGWVSRQGILTESPLRGVKMNVVDALLHPDTVHRGSGQLLPAGRRAFYGAQLSAEPRLVEPIFLVEIQCPEKCLNGVYNVMNARRGVINDITQKSNNFMLKAHLPVIESFGFNESLRAATSGQAFPQCSFSHWQEMEESPLKEGGKTAQIVSQIRKKKGLNVEVPNHDKLDVIFHL